MRGLDLTNKRFGKLIAIKPTGESKNGSRIWECQCDCGNICYVTARNLNKTNKPTQSCGCLNHPPKDLKNQRFGRLIALYPTGERDNNRSIIWHCKCDCGNECNVSSSNLIRSNRPTHSCGCLKNEKAAERMAELGKNTAIDLTNQRFGKLIALEPTNERRGTHIVWKCQCDCGNICYVRSSFLKQGQTKSCGCLKSGGELKIAQILLQENIPFKKEVHFKNLRSLKEKLLRFDFYINNKILLEIDGQQHFYSSTYFGDDLKGKKLKQRQLNDIRKNKFCLNNNIPLYRIPYYELNNVNSLQDIISEKYLVKTKNHYNIKNL